MAMQMGTESTIRGYIASYRSDEMTLDGFYHQRVLTDKNQKRIVVNEDNVLIKYMSELKTCKRKESLSNEDYVKYRFNPKLMSFDLYGTTELWALLLDINELTSATQFDLRELWVFPPYIVDRLQRALNLEQEGKDYNKEEVAADLMS